MFLWKPVLFKMTIELGLLVLFAYWWLNFYASAVLMENQRMSPVRAGRRDPPREAVVGATIPMATPTKDTECLSVTSPTMWNGKPSKTWWKRKVRCFGKRLELCICISVVVFFSGVLIQGQIVWPHHFWRPSWSGTSDLLVLWNITTNWGVCCKLVQMLCTWIEHGVATKGHCNLWGVCEMGVDLINASWLMWRPHGLGSWMA